MSSLVVYLATLKAQRQNMRKPRSTPFHFPSRSTMRCFPASPMWAGPCMPKLDSRSSIPSASRRRRTSEMFLAFIVVSSPWPPRAAGGFHTAKNIHASTMWAGFGSWECWPRRLAGVRAGYLLAPDPYLGYLPLGRPPFLIIAVGRLGFPAVCIPPRPHLVCRRRATAAAMGAPALAVAARLQCSFRHDGSLALDPTPSAVQPPDNYIALR